jgi:surfactin synthase thioesterase subunit
MASWLVDVHANPQSDHVLYAIPHAGAGVGATRPLLHQLGEFCGTTGVRLPGRESLLGQPPLTDIGVLAV